MNPQDFNLSILDRAIEIVEKQELYYAYSCFALARAISEAKGDPDNYEHYTPESSLYERFAEIHFKSIPEAQRGRVQSNGYLPFWWSRDWDETGRQIGERVALMKAFREWLVKQGATACMS